MCKRKFKICCFNYYWLLAGSCYLSRSLTRNLFPYSCFLLNSTECVYMFSYWCITLTPKETIGRSGDSMWWWHHEGRVSMNGTSDCPSFIYVVIKCSHEQLCGKVTVRRLTTDPITTTAKSRQRREYKHACMLACFCSALFLTLIHISEPTRR